MSGPSKFRIFGLKRKRESSPCVVNSKRIKSDGYLLKTSAKPFETEDVKVLSREEFIRSLQNPEFSINIEVLNSTIKLCQSKKPFDSSFFSNGHAINQVIQVCTNKNQRSLHLASIKLIAEVVKNEYGSQSVDISIPYITRFLEPSNSELCIEAIKALRNIQFSTDTSVHILITAGAITSLSACINENIELVTLKDITHTFVKVFQSDPPLTNAQKEPLLKVLQRLLFHPNDEVLGNACCILDLLTKSLIGPFTQIINRNIIPPVIEHLSDWNLRVSTNALSVISNVIFRGPFNQVQLVFYYDILTAIPGLLKHESLQYKTLTLAIEIMMREEEKDIQKMLDLKIPETVIKLLQSDDKTVCNMSITYLKVIADRGRSKQISCVLNMDLIPALCDLLYPPRNILFKIIMITIGSYLDASRFDSGMMKKILESEEILLNQINKFQQLPGSFDLQSEALKVKRKMALVRAKVDCNLASLAIFTH